MYKTMYVIVCVSTCNCVCVSTVHPGVQWCGDGSHGGERVCCHSSRQEAGDPGSDNLYGLPEDLQDERQAVCGSARPGH